MREWHGYAGGREWRVTPEGIECHDPDGATYVCRTRGEPWTARRYLTHWRRGLVAASQHAGVPLALLLQVIATENGPAVIEGGEPRVIPVRREPGYESDEKTPHRISVGPCHLLVSTAREAMGDAGIDRAWLQDVGNNLRAAAAYISSQRDETGYDPILVSAAYNAGGIYEAIPGESRYGNPWHLRTYGNHLDRAAAWYGDAAAVLYEFLEVASLDMGGLGRVRAA